MIEIILAALGVLLLALIALVIRWQKHTDARFSEQAQETSVLAELHSALHHARTEIARLEAERAGLQERLDSQHITYDEVKAAFLQERTAHASAREALATAQTRLQEQAQANQQQTKQLQASQAQFETFIKQYADASLHQKGELLATSNKQQLDMLLTPLREQLGDFRKRVDHVYAQESQDRRSLSEQVNQLKQLNEQLSHDAINLTKALKGDNKAQGNWGEMVLEKVLEQSGLRSGHEYHAQVNLTQTSGKRLQPDVVVHLPDNKDVVIDAKVSLVSYDRYVGADNDVERDVALDSHIQSLKGHIANLSDKSYEAAEGVRSLDYVLLFIPVESAYMLALQSKKGEALFVDAMQRNIMIVSPATLLMALRTIHNIWRYEHQSQNAKEIARQAEELHKKMVDYITSMEAVGVQLGRAQESYDTAFKRLSSGRGNLINRAQSIVRLGGIKPKKQIREDLIQQALETDLDAVESVDATPSVSTLADSSAPEAKVAE